MPAIVDAALAILAAEGLEAMSMRRVAAELDTAAGSLYVYVEGRNGLLEAVLDRIIAAIKLDPPDPKRWRPRTHSLVRRTRDALVAHPGIAVTMMVDPPRTPTVLTLLENLLGHLLAGGLDAQSAAWGADILTAQLTHAAIEAELRTADSVALARRAAENFARLPAEQFPLITAHSAALVAGSVDQRFRFAVDVVLDGLLARQAATGTS